jgi:hypothetical protein
VSSVTCAGVSWDLKERVKRFGSVSWGEGETLHCEAMSCFEAGELLSGIGKVLEDVLELLVETASRWIRADRDSH